MIEGKNSEVVHEGQRYHVQTEFMEAESDFLISQVFLNGQVVYQKKYKLKVLEVGGEAQKQIAFLHEYVITNIKDMML